MGRKSLSSKSQRKSSAKNYENDDVYDLKDVLDYENRGGQDYFQVSWQGYSDSEATWEPRENILAPSSELLQKMESLKSAKTSSTKSGGRTSSPRRATSSRSGSPAARPASKRKRMDQEVGNERVEKKAAVAGKEDSATAAPAEKEKEKQPQSAETSRRGRKQQSTAAAAAAPTGATTRGGAAAAATAPSAGAGDTETPVGHVGSVYVKGVRQDATHVLIVTIVGHGDSERRIPINLARLQFPQQLLDFLLNRIQFKPSSAKRQPSAGAASGSG